MLGGIFIAALLLAGTPPTVPAKNQIIWPGDRAIAAERTAALVMKTEGLSQGDIAISVQGTPLTTGAVHLGEKFGPYLHAAIALVPGLNRIEVRAKGAGKSESSTFLPDPLEEVVEAPRGYSSQDFHIRSTEILCAGCHFKKVGEECARCHTGMSSRKVVHIPVLGGQCDLCHGSVKGAASRFALVSQPPAQCLQCHENIKNTLAKKPFTHGPASAGACTLCHSPHSTDFPFLLRKKPFDLCTSCHVEKKEGRHMIAGIISGESHPVGAPGEKPRLDPKWPGGEFSCISCHDPHASLVREMWRFDTKERFGFCQSCHQK